MREAESTRHAVISGSISLAAHGAVVAGLALSAWYAPDVVEVIVPVRIIKDNTPVPEPAPARRVVVPKRSIAARESSLAENDVVAALRLTDRSPECEALLAEVFQDDEARVKQILGEDGDKLDIRDASVMRFVTFYDKPLPQDLAILQPVPQQLVTIMVETEKGNPVWLGLKMSYGPYFGTRYICGGEIG